MIEIEVVGDKFAAEVAAPIISNENRVEIDWLDLRTEGTSPLSCPMLASAQPLPPLALSQESENLLADLPDFLSANTKKPADFSCGHPLESQLVDQIMAQANAKRLDLRPVFRGVHHWRLLGRTDGF